MMVVVSIFITVFTFRYDAMLYVISLLLYLISDVFAMNLRRHSNLIITTVLKKNNRITNFYFIRILV